MNHGEMRIGDAEREAAVRTLGEHYAAGRLTKEEYDERSDRAWAARTGSQLWPLFQDLPNLAAQQRGGAPSTWPPRQGGGEARTSWGRGFPFWPVVVLLLVLTVVTHFPFFVFLLIAWLLISGPLRHGWRRRQHEHRQHHPPHDYRGWR